MELLAPARTAAAFDFANTLDGGSVVLYDGEPDIAPAQDPLVAIRLGVPAFRVEDAGVVRANGDLVGVVMRTGRATWGELVTAGGAVQARLSVSATDSGADVLLRRVDLERGGACAIESFLVIQPSS